MRKCKHIIARVHGEPVEGIVHGAEEEEKYVITPKGCAMLAFADSGIEIDEDSFNYFWNEFEEHLNKVGYTII